MLQIFSYLSIFLYFILFYFWLNIICSVFFCGLNITSIKKKITDGAKHKTSGSDFQRVMLARKAPC